MGGEPKIPGGFPCGAQGEGGLTQSSLQHVTQVPGHLYQHRHCCQSLHWVPPTGMPLSLLCHHPQSDLRRLSQPCSLLGRAPALQHGWGAAAQPTQHRAALAIHAVALSSTLWWLSGSGLLMFLLVHGLILTFLSPSWVPITTGMVL